MKKEKTAVDEYKEIFVKLHRYQHHGANNLIALLSRYLRKNTEYMVTYIDLVSERSGVQSTSRITTTNADIMKPVVVEMVRIDKGVKPNSKDIDAAWDAFISDYLNHKIEL
jgi:hypothetical protein